MAGRVLLDTNIVIALFAADPAVQKRLQADVQVFIPSIVLGELYYGAHNAARVAKNVERLDAFAQASSILVCNDATARVYGQVKAGLRRKGRPIPENDVWIAVLAQQYRLKLISRDKHFEAW